jgi:hypothetical protein
MLHKVDQRKKGDHEVEPKRTLSIREAFTLPECSWTIDLVEEE